jgi:hypothetical protein
MSDKDLAADVIDTNCRRSLAPVMSPPTTLGLPASNPEGDSVEVPTTRSRKPGANGSIRAVIASVASLS